MRVWSVLCALVCMLLQGCAMHPEPISLEEHQARVRQDQLDLYANQEPLTQPLTLDMAIARALRYNYDHKLMIMEAAFHNQQLTAATYAMLPKLAANAGYANRDNEQASSSISYQTHQQTLEPSVSSERDRRTADLTLTWTVLDFGLGYFQAAQQADRYLIMQERRRRRVVNNIVKEVVGAYWKAVTAKNLLPLVNKALYDAQKALDVYTAMQKEKLAPPLETLEQHRDILGVISSLRRIEADLHVSRIKLAALINAPLHMPFELAPADQRLLTPPPLTAALEELENQGLALRPDLREEAYQERIDKAEVHKEILRMLPGVSLFAGANYDANKFLVHNWWDEVGARVTMNLVNLVSGPVQIEAANTRVEVTRTRRLAQTVAALVQINLSYHEYRQALEDFEYAKKINDVESKIYKIARSERENQAQSEVALIRRSVNAVRTQIEHDKALAEIHQLWGNLYFSLGGDVAPQFVEGQNLDSMAAAVRNSMDRWWRGELPFELSAAVAVKE